MSASATATYFIQNNISFIENPTFNVDLRTGFGVGTLVDNDLIRGDDPGEAVTLGFGLAPGGGFRPFFTGEGTEVLTSVTFTDGTTLTGVESLFSSNISYGVGDYFFLFETAALASVGKTVTDVARVNSFTSTDHNLHWADVGFTGGALPIPEPDPVPELVEGIPATAIYFSQNNQSFVENPTSDVTLETDLGIATLVDNDLIRGDDTGEAVTLGLRILGGGPQRLFTNEWEVLTSVTFTDGTTLTEVDALLFSNASSSSFGVGTNFFLFDTKLLSSVGKSVLDVARVDSFTFTDHNLNWFDVGFNQTGVSLPEPDLNLNLMEGTSDDDLLRGTSGDDLIRGGDGDDRLIGGKGDDLIIGGNGDDRLTSGKGEDTFVFGADARDGQRDRDVITDYNAALDTIVLEAGATIRSTQIVDNGLLIKLEGDGDTILVQNAGPIIVGNFVFTDDLFVA